MTLLLAKIFFSILVVLGLSWVAEHVNSRVAGILAGMPLGGVLVLFFIGQELGPEFAAESALFGIPSIMATIMFALGYYFSSTINIRYSPLVSAVGGLVGYFLAAGLLSMAQIGLELGAVLSLTALVTFAYIFRSSEDNKVPERVDMTYSRMLFRSGMAASFVVFITSAAELIGSQWSGLLIGFPMTFLPFLLIIHITYSAAQVRAVIRNFPLGLVSLLLFLIVANKTILILGVVPALFVSLAGALIYLFLLGVIIRRRKLATV